jgi:hypothetical protein
MGLYIFEGKSSWLCLNMCEYVLAVVHDKLWHTSESLNIIRPDLLTYVDFSAETYSDLDCKYNPTLKYPFQSIDVGQVF